MAKNTRLRIGPTCLAALISLLGAGTSAEAETAQCRLDPVSQEFEWSREFQGVPKPISWKISRQVKFQPTSQEGVYQVSESLLMDLPEFRHKLAKYMGSARLTTCELQFSARPRTPTSHGGSIKMPFKVKYETAHCKNLKRVCRSRGYLFHGCDKFKRTITASDAAEIDVTFNIELQEPDLTSVVSWQQTPFYSELYDPAARSLFEQVLNDGSIALEFITGTLGRVSIASLGDQYRAVWVNGEFTLADASTYQADATYKLTSEQVCEVREKLFQQRYGAGKSVAP